MSRSALHEIFDQVQRQREPVYERLSGVSLRTLWGRPGCGGWSYGQNLEHLHKLMRLARWTYRVAIVVEYPIARLRRGRPYPATMPDPFASAKMAAPLGVRPRDRASAPLPFAVLRRSLDDELTRWRAMATGMPQEVAGHVTIWDPFVGWINMVQAAELLRSHEAHHLGIVAKRLDATLRSGPIIGDE